MNNLTADMNPTKTLEYLAARKPVVSTAIPDMVELFKGFIPTAQSPEDFLKFCEVAVENPESFPLDQGVERAAGAFVGSGGKGDGGTSKKTNFTPSKFGVQTLVFLFLMFLL